MTRNASLLKAPLLLAATFAMTFVVQAQAPSYVQVSSPFPVEQKTTIPSQTLKPGTYSISIVDHLKDRYILRVDDSQSNPVATFIGIRHTDFAPIAKANASGATLWAKSPKGEAAVRGFTFPNGYSLEFVYPKAEAVTLAKLNANSVLAIDPESEGRQPDPKLTPEDREIVTLWMLTSTRVGTPKDNTAAIEAKRYVAEPEQPLVAAKATPTPVQLAANEPPPAPMPPARPTRVHARAAAKRLPQTASYLPAMMLSSLFLLGTAGWLRRKRLA